eukprot:GHVS01031593.1.p2 GENE.GHVS01031593.1~~GHVS01031593.1.p2  ORF type:complete len:519 (-),score=138.33 GHVS01031593.1:216-1772(-)
MECTDGTEGVNIMGVPVCLTQVSTQPIVVGCKAINNSTLEETTTGDQAGGGLVGEDGEQTTETKSTGGSEGTEGGESEDDFPAAVRFLGVFVGSRKSSSSSGLASSSPSVGSRRSSFSASGVAPLSWLRAPLAIIGEQQTHQKEERGDEVWEESEEGLFGEIVDTSESYNVVVVGGGSTDAGNGWLEAEKQHDDDALACTEILTSATSHVCPAGSPYRVNVSTCKQIYTYPPELQCPPGMYLHKHHNQQNIKAAASSSSTTTTTVSTATGGRRVNSVTTKTSTSDPPSSSSSSPSPPNSVPHHTMASTATCVSSHVVAADWSCPEGYRIVPTGGGDANSGGKKKKKHKSTEGRGGGGVISSPQLTIMPNIFTGASFNQQIRTFDKKLKKTILNNMQATDSALLHGGSGMCERLEYAKVQIVCPVGYRMAKDTNKKEPGKGCVAEKTVPATYICKPGFFMRGAECVMLVEVAPSVVTVHGDSVPCSMAHSNSMACGGLVQPYFSPLKQPKKKHKHLKEQ